MLPDSFHPAYFLAHFLGRFRKMMKQKRLPISNNPLILFSHALACFLSVVSKTSFLGVTVCDSFILR